MGNDFRCNIVHVIEEQEALFDPNIIGKLNDDFIQIFLFFWKPEGEV